MKQVKPSKHFGVQVPEGETSSGENKIVCEAKFGAFFHLSFLFATACKQVVVVRREEVVRAMVCINCGQLWSDRPWQRLHALPRLTGLKRLQARRCLVFVAGVLLFTGSVVQSEDILVQASENKNPAEVIAEKKDATLSAGWWAGRRKPTYSGDGQGFANDARLGSVEEGGSAAALSQDIEGEGEEMPPNWGGRYAPAEEDLRYIRAIGYSEKTQQELHDETYVATQPGIELNSLYNEGESVRYDSLYRPRNSILGRHDLWVVDGDRIDLTARGNLNLPFVSSFEPGQAHIKAGPLYLEFIHVGVGILYSDYNGVREFPEGQEDGWLSVVELALRGSARITDQFHISLATRIVYLPGENRFGLALNDGGGLGTSFQLNCEFQRDTWNFLIYNDFRGYTSAFLLGLGETTIQRAGRYTFGLRVRDRRSNNYFDDEDIFFVNTLGAVADTPFLWQNWRLRLQADHSDYWRTLDFDYRGPRDHLSAWMGYEGSEIPFAPYVSYDVSSFDRFKSLYNTAYIGGRGRLTQNLWFDGRAGKLWTTNRNRNRNSPLWRAGLIHDISENTQHSLWGGQTFAMSDVTNETALAEYIRYQINHQFSTRLWGYAYAQFSRQEDIAVGSPVNNRETYGARLDYQLFDYSRLSGTFFHQKRSLNNAKGIERKRWLYRIQWEQQVYFRTTARLYYQFENQEGGSNFDERVLYLSARRYF
ncbi:MAG: hypothetical protein L3J39_07740 [Verrucomicrobiales bacterium]|nr:hypothetical protein [Verrucomicrobiales bacterium]